MYFTIICMRKRIYIYNMGTQYLKQTFNCGLALKKAYSH